MPKRPAKKVAKKAAKRVAASYTVELRYQDGALIRKEKAANQADARKRAVEAVKESGEPGAVARVFVQQHNGKSVEIFQHREPT
jgi:hypothetical protein